MPFTDFANLNWQPAHEITSIPAHLKEVILDESSLTYRLRRLYGDKFVVRVISHKWQELHSSEQAFLNCNDQWGSVREVLLMGADKPAVFAQSIMPQTSLGGDNITFLSLGNRPLGEFIFKQPNCHRGIIEAAKIQASRFNMHYDFNVATETAWARRSLFHLQNGSIAVYEVFLTSSDLAVNLE